MRLAVCSLLFALYACGKAESDPDASAANGEGGAHSDAGASGSGPGSADAGESGKSSGGSAAGGSPGSAVGGSPDLGGSAGDSGANGVRPNAGGGDSGGEAAIAGGTGGAAGSSGADGSSGAPGSPSFGCAGTYDVCGCGCCGAAMNTACYYPDAGDQLTAIIADDQELAQDPACANSGCSSGVRRVCCEIADEDPSASYEANGWSSDAQYLILSRESAAGRCTSVTLRLQAGQAEFKLGAGEAIGPATRDGQCNEPEEPALRPLLGALGFVRSTPPPRSCAYDFDFSLFFLADDGSVEAVRFKADRVSLPGFEGGNCN